MLIVILFTQQMRWLHTIGNLVALIAHLKETVNNNEEVFVNKDHEWLDIGRDCKSAW